LRLQDRRRIEKKTQIERLLEALCTDYGFCLPADEIAKFVALPPDSIRDFTDAVFRAEGLDPDLADRCLWRQVRDRVPVFMREQDERGCA